MELTPSPEEPTIPRWVQITAGIVLLPFTLLSLIGAVSIFGIPKVQGDPLLQLFTGHLRVVRVGSRPSIRLIFGIRGSNGLLGPTALRIAAIVAIGLLIGGAFTGIYVEHPVRSVLLAASYVVVSIKLWRLAAYRSKGDA